MILCSPQLGLSPKSILGGEVFDCEILVGLARKGVKVSVIIPKGLNRPASSSNLKFIDLPFSHFPAPFFNFLVLPQLFYSNRKEKIDILRLHQPQFLFIAALLFKLFNPKVKIVANYHQLNESVFGIFSKRINNFWDLIVCDSYNVKNQIVKNYSLDKEKILVVHNGVPKYLKPLKKDLSYAKKLKIDSETTKVLLFMGRFIHRKNPLFLLEVLKRLKNHNVVLLFWGHGPLKEAILNKARSLNLSDKIRIVPPAFGSTKNLTHNLSDVFVHPSFDEGFALAPLEAMACAKPIIMNNSYSASEAVESAYNGFLCKTNDVNSWVEALNSILHDKVTMLKMGKNSLKKAKDEFDWDKSVMAHLNRFKRFVS